MKLDQAGPAGPACSRPGGTLRAMNDRPPTNPAKLLDQWMEWERGETPPGRVMSNLKTGGLRELLESLVEADAAGIAGAD